MASALYGVFIGVAFFVFTRLVPQPVDSVILWSFFGVQLTWFSVTCWRRTGLPFATAAGVTGAVMSTCLVVLAAMGHTFPTPEAWVVLAGGLVIGPLFVFIESRVNRAKWAQWARHMEHASVWDIVTRRHIPYLRNVGD